MSSISIAGDTSGSVILQAPSVAGSTTLTLPTTTGTLVTSNAMPTGSVLQVVQGTYSTFTSSSSSTYADTGLSVSITPSSSSNKILAFSSMVGVGKNTGNTKVKLRLVRGSTTIDVFATEAAGTPWSGTTQLDIGTLSAIALDSPSTTSSITYKIQFASEANVTQVFINNTNETPEYGSTLTLMEIKA